MKHDLQEQKEQKTARAQQIGHEQIRRVDQYLADEKRTGRRGQLECRVCFYLRGGIAGAAFTRGECKACGTAFDHPNTAVPDYCTGCASKHQVCRRCGADLDYNDLEAAPAGRSVRLPFGFRWGPVDVTRVAYDKARGGRWVLMVKSAVHHLVLQVTPTGQISGYLGKPSGENLASFSGRRRKKTE